MRQFVGILCAAVIAALVPSIYFGASGAGSLAFVIAFLWIVLLGLPAFFILQHHGLIRWWSAVVSGFVLGAVPMALVSWPYRPGLDSGYSAWDGHKMVDYIVHGVPTHAGWAQYFVSSGGMGLMGAASAAMFWVVWRLIVGPNQSSKRREKPRAA